MPRSLPQGPILVDASFVLGLLFGEQAAVRFSAVLSRASMVDVNLGEVFCEIDQRVPTAPKEIAEALSAQGLRVIPVGIAGAAHFPWLKTLDQNHRVHQWAKGIPDQDIRSLSLADLACLSVAIDRRLPILTGERHWPALGVDVPIEDYRDPDLVL